MTTAPIALVTGGNRGLGRSAVEALIRSGADVIFTYRSNEAEAAAVVQAVTSGDRRAAALPLDVTDTAAVTGFAPELRAQLAQWDASGIDILVNNAGIAGQTPLGATEAEELDTLFAVHVKGVYLLTQAIATAPEGEQPVLNDGGRIINLSSGLARFVVAPNSFYGAMKGAVEVLTRYWAQELGGRGVTVNTIAPGPVATDFGGGYLRDNDELQQGFTGMTALGRIATADDIGPAIAALVGDGNGWITGQRIEASGGFKL